MVNRLFTKIQLVLLLLLIFFVSTASVHAYPFNLPGHDASLTSQGLLETGCVGVFAGQPYIPIARGDFAPGSPNVIPHPTIPDSGIILSYRAQSIYGSLIKNLGQSSPDSMFECALEAMLKTRQQFAGLDLDSTSMRKLMGQHAADSRQVSGGSPFLSATLNLGVAAVFAANATPVKKISLSVGPPYDGSFSLGKVKPLPLMDNQSHGTGRVYQTSVNPKYIWGFAGNYAINGDEAGEIFFDEFSYLLSNKCPYNYVAPYTEVFLLGGMLYSGSCSVNTALHRGASRIYHNDDLARMGIAQNKLVHPFSGGAVRFTGKPLFPPAAVTDGFIQQFGFGNF